MGLDCTLSADRDDDGVTITLTAENTGSEPVELTFPDGQVVEIVAEQDETEVWRYGADRMFAQALQVETLAAGGRLSESVTWPGSSAGTYRIRAWLCANDIDCEAATTITV
ncbi:MAG: BsuPI-related putative proteinase inhibitor [Halapricum sp.]